VEDGRWQQSVERRLDALEQEVHGKNGLTVLVAAIDSKMTWIGVVSGSLLVAILAGVIVNIVS
jgi:hypothetical protein